MAWAIIHLPLALANVHVDELRALHAEEVEVALCGHSLGEQCLPGPCAVNPLVTPFIAMGRLSRKHNPSGEVTRAQGAGCPVCSHEDAAERLTCLVGHTGGRLSGGAGLG